MLDVCHINRLVLARNLNRRYLDGSVSDRAISFKQGLAWRLITLSAIGCEKLRDNLLLVRLLTVYAKFGHDRGHEFVMPMAVYYRVLTVHLYITIPVRFRLLLGQAENSFLACRLNDTNNTELAFRRLLPLLNFLFEHPGMHNERFPRLLRVAWTRRLGLKDVYHRWGGWHLLSS